MMAVRSWGAQHHRYNHNHHHHYDGGTAGALMRDRDDFRRRMMALLRLDKVGDGKKLVLAYSRKKRSSRSPDSVVSVEETTEAAAAAAARVGQQTEDDKPKPKPVRIEGMMMITSRGGPVGPVATDEVHMSGVEPRASRVGGWEMEEEREQHKPPPPPPPLQQQYLLSHRSRAKTCLVCGTNNTPLWRPGPAGPKTLCNACGIRYRKLKRKRVSSGSSTPSTTVSEDYAVREDRRIIMTTTTTTDEDDDNDDDHALDKKRDESALRQWQRRKQERQWMLLQQRHKFAARCGEQELEAAFLLMALSSGLFSRRQLNLKTHHRHPMRRHAHSSTTSSKPC